MITQEAPARPDAAAGEPHSPSLAVVEGRIDEPRLYYQDGQGHHRKLELSAASPRVVVGRSAQADVALTSDRCVSRLHAVIECVGTHWTIIDDGLSLNGTFVNGIRLAGRRRLKPGDSIRIGTSQLTYHCIEGIRAGETGVAAKLPRWSVTECQREVLVALCQPYKHKATFASPASNVQIAKELHLGAATIKTHLRALFVKFGIEDLPQNQKRARLAERALHAGIVTDRDL